MVILISSFLCSLVYMPGFSACAVTLQLLVVNRSFTLATARRRCCAYNCMTGACCSSMRRGRCFVLIHPLFLLGVSATTRDVATRIDDTGTYRSVNSTGYKAKIK